MLRVHYQNISDGNGFSLGPVRAYSARGFYEPPIPGVTVPFPPVSGGGGGGGGGYYEPPIPGVTVPFPTVPTPPVVPPVAPTTMNFTGWQKGWALDYFINYCKLIGVPLSDAELTALYPSYVLQTSGTPTTTSPLGQINTGGNNMADGAEWGPQTQYLRALGLGQGYQNPAQRYLANLYDQFRNIWGLQSPINTATGGATPGWEQYIGNLGAGAGGMQQNVYSQAAATLQRLLGMTPGERTLGGFGVEPTYDEYGNLIPAGEAGETLSMGGLQNLIGMGTSQRFNPLGANWLAGRVPQIRQQWQLGRAGGGETGTFLDYLRQKYNL